MIAFVSLWFFTVSGVVRDGALYLGRTHPTRFVVVVLQVIALSIMYGADGLLLALAFAPGIWWAPFHGDALRFGERADGRQLWRAWRGIINAVCLTALPTVALYALASWHALILPAVASSGRLAAYALGWWIGRHVTLPDDLPPTRIGQSMWFAAIGGALWVISRHVAPLLHVPIAF